MTNFDDIFSQMRCWESYIAKYLYERKVIVPLSQDLDSDVAEQFEATGIEGAYVMEPLLGLKEWCVSFDYDSLYPNIIRMLNISPECLVPEHELIVDKTVEDHLKASPSDRLIPEESGFSHAINGVLYRKDVTGFIPEIIAG